VVSSTVFVVSPARCDGDRARLLVTSEKSELAARVRSGTASIGEVFAWLSALYFRGKLTYARAFARPPARVPGVLVMAAGLGLVEPERRLTADELRAMGEVEIESDQFTTSLRRDAALVERACGAEARVVLLGSVASGKYVDSLLEIFGPRLLFPETFVGRGDMSRGGLLLRAARSHEELTYLPVEGAIVRGKRPPKLPRLRR